MASPAIVIYVKDDKVKTKLKLKAQKSHKSISEYVRELIENDLSSLPKPKTNPLLQFAGILNTFMTREELEEYDKVTAEVPKLRKSKPDSYYENMFN